MLLSYAEQVLLLVSARRCAPRQSARSGRSTTEIGQIRAPGRVRVRHVTTSAPGGPGGSTVTKPQRVYCATSSAAGRVAAADQGGADSSCSACSDRGTSSRQWRSAFRRQLRISVLAQTRLRRSLSPHVAAPCDCGHGRDVAADVPWTGGSAAATVCRNRMALARAAVIRHGVDRVALGPEDPARPLPNPAANWSSCSHRQYRRPPRVVGEQRYTASSDEMHIPTRDCIDFGYAAGIRRFRRRQAL